VKVDSSPYRYLVGKIDSLSLHLSLPPFRDFTSLLHNLETAVNKDLDGTFPWPCWRMDLKKKQQLHLPAATHERKSKWLVPWTEMVHLPSPTQRSGEPNNNRNNNLEQRPIRQPQAQPLGSPKTSTNVSVKSRWLSSKWGGSRCTRVDGISRLRNCILLSLLDTCLTLLCFFPTVPSRFFLHVRLGWVASFLLRCQADPTQHLERTSRQVSAVPDGSAHTRKERYENASQKAD
jgi:hypothetical protein